jgi:16S rRNA (adenine1518-N6/adenine1519-N6)-dimethyltransferase
MTVPKLGQNFLINRNVAQKIVDAFLPVEGEILEIGPGKGVLTELLVKTGVKKKVKAVERDKKLCSFLKNKKFEGVQIINRDILAVELEHLFSSSKRINIISNVPYYISSEIIDWVITQEEQIKKGIFMMQREFVGKLISSPASKKTSAQAIIFKQLFQLKKLFVVNPGSFRPPPKVKSVVFSFENIFKEGLSVNRNELKCYYSFLKICFQNRRKTLINNLAECYNIHKLKELFASLHLYQVIRAEQVQPDDFFRIFHGVDGR